MFYPNQEKILRYIVKVKYGKDGEGSGVIIPLKNNDYSYVLTAKHTFGKDKKERGDNYYKIVVNDIETSKVTLSNPYKINLELDGILEVNNIDSKIDLLILKVKNNKELNDLETLKIFNDDFKHCLPYGFPNIAKEAHTLYEPFKCEYKPIASNTRFEMKVLNFPNIEENLSTKKAMSGLSGSGVYIKISKEEIGLVGIVIKASLINNVVCLDLQKLIKDINRGIDTPIPIVESQEKKYSDIKQILKEQYNDVDEFKQAILEYYPSDSDNFDKIKKINTIDELFLVLLEEKWCLYCLLKELKKPHNLEEFSDTDCSKKREQALKTRIVETIILKFKENKSRDDYTIQGWLKHDSGSYRNMSVLNNIKFDNNEYKVMLSEYLVTELKGKNYPTPLQLELILPIELFTVEFKTLKIKLNSIIPQEKEFNRVFDISTKFLINIENYYNSELIRNWQENSKCYRDNLEEMIENRFLFHIEDISKKEMLDGYNNNNKISILSNYSLLNSTTLVEMINYGLPFTICPQNKDYDIVNTICFNNELVRGMKQIIFNFIREKRNESSLHYIYDNYYDYDKNYLKISYHSVEYQEEDDDNYLE